MADPYSTVSDLYAFGLPRGALPNPGRLAASALASTDTPPEVAEDVVRDLIGSQLDPMTREVDRAIGAN